MKLPKFFSAHSKEDDLKSRIPFDPEIQEAVIRSSICTGEKVAGFLNKTDGHFTEVMLIKNTGDEEHFRAAYHLTSVRTIY